MEEDVLFDPVKVSSFGAGAVMFQAGGFMDFLEKGRFCHKEFIPAGMLSSYEKRRLFLQMCLDITGGLYLDFDSCTYDRFPVLLELLWSRIISWAALQNRERIIGMDIGTKICPECKESNLGYSSRCTACGAKLESVPIYHTRYPSLSQRLVIKIYELFGKQWSRKPSQEELYRIMLDERRKDQNADVILRRIFEEARNSSEAKPAEVTLPGEQTASVQTELHTRMKDEKEDTEEKGAPVVLRIRCGSCGMQFVLGEDTVITTPVVPAEGALVEMSCPDSFAPMDWKTLSGSPRQAQIDIIGALLGSKILAKVSGQPWRRQWRCHHCNKVQLYILFSEDWSRTIE